MDFTKDFKDLLKQDIEDFQIIYQDTFGSKFCGSCRGQAEIAYQKLKKYQMADQFKFKKNAAIYRMEQGTSETIHNGNITGHTALKFLSIKPSRIDLFSQYPDTWQTDIADYFEDVVVDVVAPETKDQDQDQVHDKECECDDCQEQEQADKRKELESWKLAELRELYPEIKDVSKDGFIDKVLA